MDHDKAMHDALVGFRGTKRYDGPLHAAAGYAEAVRAARTQYTGPQVHPGLTRVQVERFYGLTA